MLRLRAGPGGAVQDGTPVGVRADNPHEDTAVAGPKPDDTPMAMIIG